MLVFLGTHLLVGAFVGWFILGVFILLDVGGLKTLIAANHVEYLVYPLLLVFFAITFGSVGMGIGIMGINKDDDDDNDKGLKFKFSNDFSTPIPIKIKTQ